MPKKKKIKSGECTFGALYSVLASTCSEQEVHTGANPGETASMVRITESMFYWFKKVRLVCLKKRRLSSLYIYEEFFLEKGLGTFFVGRSRKDRHELESGTFVNAQGDYFPNPCSSSSMEQFALQGGFEFGITGNLQ